MQMGAVQLKGWSDRRVGPTQGAVQPKGRGPTEEAWSNRRGVVQPKGRSPTEGTRVVPIEGMRVVQAKGRSKRRGVPSEGTFQAKGQFN